MINLTCTYLLFLLDERPPIIEPPTSIIAGMRAGSARLVHSSVEVMEVLYGISTHSWTSPMGAAKPGATDTERRMKVTKEARMMSGKSK